MKNSFFKDIIDNGNIAYLYQKIVMDKNKQVESIKILDYNRFFEEAFGEMIGVNRLIDTDFVDESGYFGKIKEALNNPLLIAYKNFSHTLSIYSKKLNKTFSLTLYFRKKLHLVAVFKELGGINDPLLDNTGRYKSIVENMHDWIWILDENFRFSYVSPSAAKLFNYNSDFFVDLNLKGFLTKDSYKKVNELYIKEKKSNDNKSIFIDIEHILPNGVVVVMEHHIQFLRNSTNDIIGVMGIGRDITSWNKAKQEIEDAKDNLELILNSTAEGIIGIDLFGRCTFCNTSFLRMFDFKEKSDFIGKNYKKLFKYAFDLDFDNNFLNTCGKREFIRSDGSNFMGEFYQYPQYKNSNLVGAVITFIDTSNFIKVENELRETERSKNVLIKNIPGMVYRCKIDKLWTMEYVSEGSTTLTGYLPCDLIDNNKLSFASIIDPKFVEEVRSLWKFVLENKVEFKQEYPIITKDGKQKWVLEQGQIVYNDEGLPEAIEGLIIDINDQVEKRRQIEYLSYHDGLTGLFNRIYFEKQIRFYDKAKYYPLSIILSDINGLKLLNDAVGHMEGDKLLVETTELLKRTFNDGEVIARIGGDEFGILMPNTSDEDAYIKLLYVQEKIKEYNKNISPGTYTINLALGYGTKETHEIPFSKVQKIAEDKMYKRKLLERNSSHSSLISSIKATMIEKSISTKEHAERLRDLTVMFGEKINLTQDQLAELSLLATLHDIGKVGIDENILNKPGKLTEEEWVEMRKHPEKGYRILISSPELRSIADTVLHHHERWDGKGYPKGLTGEEIPILSRIIAITDTYDAMTNDRPYRRAFSKEETLQEIKRCLGTQFDPHLGIEFISFMNNDSCFSKK